MSTSNTRFSAKMSFVPTFENTQVIINESSNKGEKSIDKLISDTEENKLEEIKLASYNQGWQECEAQYKQKILQLEQQLQSVQNELPISLGNYFSQLEEQVKKEIGTLAFGIAEIILKKELANPDHAKSAVDSVLQQLMNYEGITLKLNPIATATLKESNSLPPEITVEDAPQLLPGEALVECSQGIIDGRLETRLNSLQEQFDTLLKNGEKSS